MISTTDAIVLKTMKYRESSLIATLLTRDFGKLSVIAKGVRNKQRGGGLVLEPMNYVRTVIYRKPGRELQLMTQCDQIRAFRGLSEDLTRMGAGMALIELANLAMAPEQAHPEVLDLMVEILGTLGNETRHPEQALYYFEIQMLGLLGFRPELRRCVLCALPLEDIPSKPGMRLAMGMHGMLCPACEHRGDGEMSITLPALKALAALQDTPHAEAAFRIVLSGEMRITIESVLRRLVMHHLTGMKPLQSEQVFSMLS
jgi:DNA repair protein RecO (recombination protein O)